MTEAVECLIPPGEVLSAEEEVDRKGKERVSLLLYHLVKQGMVMVLMVWTQI